MIAAIHQPNYLPWLGYFYKMALCDVFVLLDDVQLVRGRSFTTRNKVKTSNGAQWLTVPVTEKGELKLIKDVVIAQDGKWLKKHWKTIELSYKKAPYWNNYSIYFQDVYEGRCWSALSELNITLITKIKAILGLKTKIVLSSELKGISGERSSRNLSICKHLGADTYLSGTGARNYNDEEEFRKAGVNLIYTDFKHPVYHQLWGDFTPSLSIIDLLFNEGEKSLETLLARL
jgi:hypothetical protein